MSAEMSNFLCVAIYMTSVAACGFYVWLGFKGFSGDGTNAYYGTEVIPGVAGFALFPVVNTFVAMALTWWVYLRRQSPPAESAVMTLEQAEAMSMRDYFSTNREAALKRLTTISEQIGERL